ncbi:HIT family protein [Rhodococcus erythropolis]|uniref:HIT family protein n=1 Tax=Rhodococcus erythropolis TaxID=1833 RepID=UPI0022B4D677|nr:HIT family protein [Rhodococcus erythropolis]MCZ4567710.1 HIT family protein [Rhodococcus erythropolis]
MDRRSWEDREVRADELHHEPPGYRCPFCRYALGEFDEYNASTDLVARTENVIARISPKWWPDNPGHVLVSPIEHFENLYTLPTSVGHSVFDLVQAVAVAIREEYGCDGVSTRQHNEPAGNQDVWHHHVHVFPRYEDDRLYSRHGEAAYVSPQARAPYGALLRARFSEC